MLPTASFDEAFTSLPNPFPENSHADPLEGRSGHDIQLLLDDLVRKNEHLEEEVYIIHTYLRNSNRTETVDDQRQIDPAFVARDMPLRRLEVVERQREVLSHIRVSTQQAHEDEVDELRAATRQREKEHSLFRSDEDEFRRFRVSSINQRTGHVMSERMEQYLNRTLKDQENEILKLLQRKKKMSRLLRKRTRRLKMNALESEKHNRVDFDQLKIENQQMRLREDQLNRQIVRLKSRTGKTQHLLTSLMDELSTYQSNQNKLETLIEDREQKLRDLALKIQKEEKLKDYHLRRNHQLVRHHRELRVPEVPEYVKVKSDLTTVKKECADWVRKLSIAGMNERLYGNKMRGLMGSLRQMGFMFGVSEVESEGLEERQGQRQVDDDDDMMYGRYEDDEGEDGEEEGEIEQQRQRQQGGAGGEPGDGPEQEPGVGPGQKSELFPPIHQDRSVGARSRRRQPNDFGDDGRDLRED